MTQKPIYSLCTVLLYFVGIFFFLTFFLLKNFPCTTLHALRRACSSSYSSSFLNSPKNIVAVHATPSIGYQKNFYINTTKKKNGELKHRKLWLFFSHHGHKWRRLYYLFCRPSSQRLAIYPSFSPSDIVYSSSSKCLNCCSLNTGDVADVVPFSLLLPTAPTLPFFRENTMGDSNVQYVVVVLYRSSKRALLLFVHT